MKINNSAIEFFENIPDDLLVDIAMNDWGALKRLCIALTLDVQLMVEAFEAQKKYLAL